MVMPAICQKVSPYDTVTKTVSNTTTNHNKILAHMFSFLPPAFGLMRWDKVDDVAGIVTHSDAAFDLSATYWTAHSYALDGMVKPAPSIRIVNPNFDRATA
jgi:hypothetical protein